MNGSRLVARNVLVTLLTQLLSWGLAFAVTLYLPRYLGDAGLGKLAFAVAWVGMFAVCIPLGTSTVLLKEVSRSHERAPELLAGAVALRLPLGLLIMVVSTAAVRALGYPPLTCVLVAVTSLAAILVSLNDAFSSTLGGLEQMPRQSLAVLAEKLLTSSLTVLLVLRRAPLWAIAAAPICSGCVSLAVNAAAFVPLCGSPLRLLRWPARSTLSWLVVAGMPYMGWNVFRALYGQTDPVVLSFVADDRTVGWYAAAFRLVGTSIFLPGALGAALLPTLSRLYVSDRERYRQLARRMLALAMLCGIPVSLVLLCMPSALLALLHYPPAFRASIPVLQMGGVGVLLWYAAMILGNAVIAADGQVQMVKTSALSTAVGVPLCVVGSWAAHRWLHNGAVGAMASDVSLELCLVGVYLRLVPAGTFDFDSLRDIGRCVLAALPMLLLLLFFAPEVPRLWLLAPSAVVYAISCYLLRCIDPRFFSLARAVVSRRDDLG